MPCLRIVLFVYSNPMPYKYDPEVHRRHSIRLPDYDYTQAGAYFVTLCVIQRMCLFGKIVGDEMQLNDYGRIVEEEWRQTGIARPNVVLDTFVVMPNHVHGIFMITDIGGTGGEGMARHAPTRQFGHPVAASMSTIIGAFKSAATRRVNALRQTPGEPLWQRNFHEHIIRNANEYERVSEYIANNPAIWSQDKNNPVNW